MGEKMTLAGVAADLHRLGMHGYAQIIDAHLTQPAQACEHDWAEGYGVPAYCKHCGVARVAQPAQAVDVEKVREVIHYLYSFRHKTPPTWAHLDNAADKLTAAISNANGKEG